MTAYKTPHISLNDPVGKHFNGIRLASRAAAALGGARESLYIAIGARVATCIDFDINGVALALACLLELRDRPTEGRALRDLLGRSVQIKKSETDDILRLFFDVDGALRAVPLNRVQATDLAFALLRWSIDTNPDR